MTTIPASLKAQIDADWTGAGGAAPTVRIHETYRSDPPLGEDGVWILEYTLDTDPQIVNDDFTNEFHVIDMIVNTSTSADRLKEIADEVVRILNATAITDITYQRLKRRDNISDFETFNFQERITYDLREYMKSSASAYGAGTGPALTQTQLEDLLMYTSANAAWVNCPYVEATTTGKMFISATVTELTNVDGTDLNMRFDLPIPLVKGSLKLYIANLRIALVDADADDYIDAAGIFGATYSGQTLLGPDDWTTDRTAPALVTYSMAVADDASSYNSVFVRVNCVCTNASDLGIGSVEIQCYYDT